jgi:hypothetical protein
MNEQGIIVVGKRLTEWMKNTWNRSEIVLLPNKGRFVWLYIQSVHEHDHESSAVIFLVTFLKDFVLAICISIQVTRNNFENFEMFSRLISSKFNIELSLVTTLMSDDIATPIVSGS